MTDGLLDVVIAAREEQAGIVLLDLVARQGGLPRSEAGAHVDVHVGDGIVRQYSLCGDPGVADRYRLGILRDPASRGGSSGIHDRFLSGETIRIGPPRNLFPLDWTARRSVLVGGGIGITPLIAMAYALHHAGRDFVLHYCARTRDHAAFATELAQAPFADRVRLHFSADADSGRFEAARDLGPVAGTAVYVCGPSGFMEWVLAGAGKAGFTDSQLHREYFRVEVETAGDGFAIVAQRSGRRVDVAPDQTMIQALASIGIRVEVSCEQGVCGTCAAGVLDGIPDHRDTYLTDEERAANDQVLTCCSRARSPVLVLDL